MGDSSVLAALHLPPCSPQPVGEVGVLGGANVLAEAAHLVEGGASASDVCALWVAPDTESESVVLAHRAAQVRVARRRRRVGRYLLVDDTTADQTGPRPGPRLEVAIHKIRCWFDVSVEEHDPLTAPTGRAAVAGEARGRETRGEQHLRPIITR